MTSASEPRLGVSLSLQLKNVTLLTGQRPKSCNLTSERNGGGGVFKVEQQR